MKLALPVAAIAVLMFAAPQAEAGAAYETFRFPDTALFAASVTLNNNGQALGIYFTENVKLLTLRRDPDGSIFYYDEFFGRGQDFVLSAMSRDGRAVGYWGNQGLILEADGFTFTMLDLGGFNSSTKLTDINEKGVMAGYYTDPSAGRTIPFTRSKKGVIHAIKVGNFAEVQAYAISNLGHVCGTVFEDSGAEHAFFRDVKGKAVVFDVPGAAKTYAVDVNDSGIVAGSYVDGNTVFHGYIRTADGAITTFDIAGSGTGPNQGTRVHAINKKGMIAGAILTSQDVWHGFARGIGGKTSIFDVPGGNRTVATGINDRGQVSGLVTLKGHPSGFIRTHAPQ